MSTTQSAAFIEDLKRRLAPHGIEGEGATWITKALHPTSPHTTDGLPDQNYFKTVRTEFRQQIQISAPAGLTTPTWDCVIVRYPVDISPVAVWSGDNGFYQGGTALSEQRVNVGALEAVTARFGSSAEFNSNLPDGTFSSGPYPAWIPTDRHDAFRTAYASLTTYMTASALNDGGTVYAGQFASIPEKSVVMLRNAVIAPNMWVIGAQFDDVPTDENALSRANPRYYTAQARDGVYMPFRLVGPVQEYGVMESRTIMARAGASSGTNFAADLTGETIAVRPVIEPLLKFQFSRPGITDPNSYSTSTDASAVGIVFFKGMSPQATLTLRYVLGAEYTLARDSDQLQFEKIPPRYDPRALEAYYRIVHEIPDAYPASWNSLGLLGGAIASLASRIWPVVRAVAPVAYKGVKDVIKAGTQASMGDKQVVVTPRTPRTPMRGARAKTPTGKKVKGRVKLQLR